MMTNNAITKFYIINSNGSIEWVPSLEIAKKYTTDPTNKEWFNKHVLTTTENIKVDKFKRAYIEDKNSEYVTKPSLKEELDYCISEILKHVRYVLNNIAIKEGFDSFIELLSYKDSKVDNLNKLSKKYFIYRDELMLFTAKYIEKIKNDDNLDLETIQIEFLKNLPEVKN